MTSKNKGFGADLAAVASPDQKEKPQPRVRTLSEPPKRGAGILSARTNRLAELASGAVQTRTHELIDPKRARMWVAHNRDYELLDEERCADLIESFIAQGRQEVPAIVRRVKDNSGYDFEVICGARRHWTVSWLRANNYPDFKFLVEVRDLSDEEAFRLADLENRSRQDLSDFERAKDYLKALTTYYGSKQKTMAQRLNVTESWLSRYLDLARLPQEIVKAFASPHDLKIKHITNLKPLIKKEESREQAFTAAKEIAKNQKTLMLDGAGMPAADVIRALTLSIADKASVGTGKIERSMISAQKGEVVYRFEDLRAGSTLLDSQGKKILTLGKGKESALTLYTEKVDLKKLFTFLKSMDVL